MPLLVSIRPTVTNTVLWAGAYTWHDPDGNPSGGVGIFSKQRLVQHLTPSQALKLADQLVDAAEAALRGETINPNTIRKEHRG